jgi:AcrR family transcriptional regulator
MSLLIIFVKEVAVRSGRMPIGRRERTKQDKHQRIMTAAREMFAEQGVSGVTTQQIADRADVAIGTLYQYASSGIPPAMGFTADGAVRARYRQASPRRASRVRNRRSRCS